MAKMQENAPRVCKNALFEALSADFDGVCVYAFDEIDSTNTEAKRMVADGFCGDAIITAKMQTAGRGRMGRSFFSPAQTGAYFSILHTLNTPLCDAVAITSAAAVAVMRAIRTLTGIQTKIKWVNDLYYNDRKVCGILTEAVSVSERSHVIVGIGINLDTKDFPSELADVAGSLNSHVDAALLIAEVWRELSVYLNTPTDHTWITDYRAHSLVLGNPVTWVANGISHEGIAVSIDEDGALIVRDECGESTRLHTGEISLKPLKK